MEAPKPEHGPPGRSADAAAEKLRALRARADEALGVQRDRLGTIEAELSTWVEKLAAEFNVPGAPGVPLAVNTAQDIIALTQTRVRLAAAEQYATVLEKQLAKEIAERQSQLSRRDQEKAQLERQLQDLARQVSASHTGGGIDAEQLQATHRELAAALAALRGELSGLEEQLDSQQVETDQARRSAGELEKQLGDLRQELEDAKSERDSLELYCEELRAQLAASSGDRSATAASTAQLQRELAEAHQALAALKESTVARSELAVAEAATAAAEKQRHAAEQSATEAEALAAAARQDLTAAKAEADKLRREATELTAECDRHRRALDAVKGDESTAAAERNQLAEELAELKKTTAPRAEVESLSTERDRLRRELAELRATTVPQSEADRLQAERDRLTRQLAELQKTTAPRNDVEKLAGDLTAAQGALEAATAEAAALRDDVARLKRERDAEQATNTKRIADLERDLAALQATTVPRSELERIEEQAAAADKQEADALAAAAAELDAARETNERLSREIKDLARRHDEALASLAPRAELDAAQAEKAAAEERLAALQAELNSVQDDSAAAEVALEQAKQQARDEAAAAAAAYNSEFAAAEARAVAAEATQVELQLRLDDVSERAAALQSDVDALRAKNSQLERASREQEASLADAAKSRDEAIETLSEAQARFDDFAAKAVPAEAIAELEHKFEVTLADVQKLKRENSQLREELASRPDASDHESPDLMALRAERDEMAARLAEFESAGAEQGGEELRQEYDDLQRRFEMAVDDLREAKQELESLRAQSAANPKSSKPALTFDGPMDWAAQRERLLAMLEEEDAEGAPSAERRSERASIEDAIHATEDALAAKDRELARLRAELDEARESAPQFDPQEAALQELFNADEAIQVERERLESLQTQWKEKLRQAELELSVQRATLAREQAALREKELDLERAFPKPVDPAEPGGKPKRRWLSALGLGEDETEG
ncbi:MAG: hypothetical protein KF688_12420 [Pirellulales bacterium]|nr:hypothetical protein [Pirellulales bacterium]